MAQITFLHPCHFEFGALGRLPKALKSLGVTRPLLVADPGLVQLGLVARAIDALGRDPAALYAATPANPTESAARAALALYREADCDGLIALGGGSAMDMAKAVALMAAHEGPYERYGTSQGGSRHIGPMAPVLAIPTTAGTGAEVSVALLLILDNGRKETFVSPHIAPKMALCDPELTLSLPPALTAATGMDAVAHCIEALLSPAVNPPAEAIALDGVERAIKQGMLRRAFADGADRDARWHMMMAAYEGALAFMKGLGAVHGMSHALGRLTHLNLQHGALNATILPHALAQLGDAAPEKFARLRAAMGLDPHADLSAAIFELNRQLQLPASLSAMGVSEADWPGARPYALSDFCTATAAMPMNQAEFDALFARAL